MIIVQGWARMAHPICGWSIVEVGKANLGEMRPCSVRADVTLNLNVKQHIKNEWQNLRKHDIGFLLTIRPPPAGSKQNPATIAQNIQEKYGIIAVRGCEIEGMLDIKGQVVDERPDARPKFPPGDTRTYRVWLDTNQYYSDTVDNRLDVYDSFNIFMRRNAKENNFKV